jgi:hypothetical protein
VLYVAGAGHSGSTLFSFVLNSHREIFAIGEMHAPRFPIEAPERRMCSCGSTVGSCPFFARMVKRFDEQGSRLDPLRWDLRYAVSDRPWLGRLYTGSLRSSALESLRDAAWRLSPRYRRKLAALHRDNELFFRSALEISGKSVFLDATKRPIRLRFLRGARGLDLRAIHLVRDPRAYAYSRMRDKGMTAVAAADAWARTNRNADRHLAGLDSSRWIRVRYEDFCRDTAAELARIGEFAGVGPIPVPENLRQGEHHIMGNKMRLTSGASSTIRLDERWRRELDAEHLNEIVRIAGPLARSYGYTEP